MAKTFNRLRDVVVNTHDPSVLQGSNYDRQPVDRPAARLLFAQARSKAVETIGLLDQLGEGFKIDIRKASSQLRQLVQLLDPPSKGNYISWETYKKAVDIEVASAYPDLLSYERGKSPDSLMNNERLKTLFLEQSMTVVR